MVSGSSLLKVEAISIASFQACSARAIRSARPSVGQCLRMNATTFGLVFFTDESDALVARFTAFLSGEDERFARAPLTFAIYHSTVPRATAKGGTKVKRRGDPTCARFCYVSANPRNSFYHRHGNQIVHSRTLRRCGQVGALPR